MNTDIEQVETEVETQNLKQQVSQLEKALLESEEKCRLLIEQLNSEREKREISVRNSLSHPLRIDEVIACSSLYLIRPPVIGMTFCPGKKGFGYHTNCLWNRDLDKDLNVIHQFGATALVTLMELQELDSVQVPRTQLIYSAKSHRLNWYHLPIKDKSIPDERFERQWISAGPELKNELIKGHRIVIHCLGGLGRTGIVTAKLLVDLGHSPEEAIVAVRKARPGAIENELQEKYVLGLIQNASS